MEADNETQILGLPMTHKFVRFLIHQIVFLICIVKCNKYLALLQKFCISPFRKLPWPLLQIKNTTFLDFTLIKNFPSFNLICFNKPFN